MSRTTIRHQLGQALITNHWCIHCLLNPCPFCNHGCAKCQCLQYGPPWEWHIEALHDDTSENATREHYQLWAAGGRFIGIHWGPGAATPAQAEEFAAWTEHQFGWTNTSGS